MGFRQLSVGLVLLAAASFAQAESVITTVFNVFESTKSNQLLILSAADGRIYRTALTKDNKKFFDELIGKVVNITYAVEVPGAMIKDVRPVDPMVLDDETLDLNYFAYNELRQFAPSDLQAPMAVQSVFDNMLNDGDKRRSQCFKRAHMWAFDMWSKMGVFSQKIFIFYTQRYFWLEEFDWWFHVAPLVNAGTEEYVLDGTFMERPMKVKEWSDFFMKTDKITCPTVEKYQDYEANHWKKLCVMMKVPMYYLSPLDIENRDKRGIEKTHWELPELQDARRAFKNYEDSYEGLDNGKMTKTY